MSTIATPRDSSVASRPRRAASQTPTSSSRPSLDVPRSAAVSPNPNPPAATGVLPNKRANRAALREYYKLKKNAPSGPAGAATPTLEVTSDPFYNNNNNNNNGGGGSNTSDTSATAAYSEVPASELDAADLDAAAFVAKILASQGLAELLRTYTRIRGEMRALDAEKKALVYDNYSKLLSATETIRRMRATMDPLTPMASTLDPTIGRIYEQANDIREAWRKEVRPPGDGESDRLGAEKKKAEDSRRRQRKVAVAVVRTPERLRQLVKEGKEDEARKEWELPRRLLLSWKAKGLGGDDVPSWIAEGDAILRGQDSDDKQ